MQVNNQTNYRKIDALSASQIKLFDKNRNDFYREVILKEQRKDKKSPSLALGNLIDFCLSDCNGNWSEFEQRFDEKFKLLSVKPGTGQMFLLTDLLFEYTLRDMDEEGNITSSFSVRFEEAFDKLQAQEKFKGKKVEWALEQFKDSEAETYLTECLDSIVKCVVDQTLLDVAKNRVETVMMDENVNHIFTPTTGILDLGKYVIEWEYKGLKAKSELDRLQINENIKCILITEIKSSWDIEDGFEATYLKLRYDLAMVYYIKAIEWLTLNNEEFKVYKDFDIKFQFLTVDTSNEKSRPLIYIPSLKDINNALSGFTLKSGRKFKGLDELTDEIIFHQENSIWNISKEAFKNKSILGLNLNYE